ncbi:MAG: TolC family protein, partial [Deltaproteobacteria bacterium]|nr:TolC family protein [Deltaproteobacteria bacterium]
MAQKKLDFILFLNPQNDIFWDQNIQLTTPPEPIEMEIDNIQNHIATSLRLRPDINQAYLNLQKGDFEVIRTKNGVLPRLDFFLTLESIANGSEFPASLDEFDDTDYTAGVILSRPLGNREAKSQLHRANLQRLKYQESIEYLKQKIKVEVRKAILDIDRYQEKIIASQANRKKQEEKLKVEQEKFRLGRSTNLMVFQAQRDLVDAEVNEVTAIINQIKTFIDLHMKKGTLLEQWSLDVIPPLSESL